MIQWTSSFSVNHPQLDQEHQALFHALNQFYTGIQNSVPKERMYKLIEDLLKYAKTHFDNEEKHMEAIKFPGLEKHKQEHRAFESKTSDFYSKYKSGKLLMSVEITNFIKDWITHHIKTQDYQYARFGAAKAI
jgi:hemerythrin